ncbi:MAG: 1-phosphofructokinase family hexose kinase [Clostridia bacterium]|nr:1-phosphofructokinase family hexose kinase [Clostridia bacterium]
MIHVLCLNPAIDKLYEIDSFTAGEDYPGQRPAAQAGGKGVNVARVLSQLGAQAHLYAFMGEDSEAMFRREMAGRCGCTFVTVPGACRTTINIIDRENRRETVITEAGPQVTQEDVAALLGALRSGLRAGDIVCCSGSVIAGAPEDIYAQVSRLCEAAGARCALDCNAQTLPPSLRGARYALGKPNERELAALLSCGRTQDARQIAAMARRLMPPYESLLVSMGAAGGVLAWEKGALHAHVPDMPVVSTVGSGDASLAGALWAMAQGYSPEETLRLAMACGTANAMNGDVGSVRMEDVRAAQERIYIEEIA